MRIQRFLLAAVAAVAAAGVAVDAAGDCRVKTRAPATSVPVSTTGAPAATTSTPVVTDAPASAAASTGGEAVDPTDASEIDGGDYSDYSDFGDESDVDGETSDEAEVTDAPTSTSSAPAATSAAPATTTAAPSATTATPSTTTAAPASSSSGELCSTARVTVTDITVDAGYEANEDEAGLKVLAISAKPSGGSRIAYQSGDYVYVQELDASDKVTSTAAVKVPAVDFADIYADDDGFVVLGSRDAEGGGTLNCGSPSNLCGTAPNPAVPCYDMYLIRYDGSTESWATKLTSSSASLPPYSTSGTGPEVYMIWWYAHHGRIAFDGTNWASYFGCALSVSQDSCINIHQGDRMKVVSPSGSVLSDHNSFDWGCSHSGYERITYDNRTSSFATICKTDSNNRIMPPTNWDVTIYPVDLSASNLGDIVPDSASSGGGYWATVSNGDGDDAAVHLIHFTLSAEADKDITLGGAKTNERAPHLAPIGNGGLLAVWEGSSTGGDLVEGSSDRTIYAQVRDAGTGEAVSDVLTVGSSVVGNRYQALKAYPDGSVAYLSKGESSTSLKVVRFHGC